MPPTEKYISSIVSNYGDTDNVKRDVLVLREIFNRQGSNLLLDVVAEKIGESALTFRLDANGKNNIKNSILNHLKNALDERT